MLANASDGADDDHTNESNNGRSQNPPDQMLGYGKCSFGHPAGAYNSPAKPSTALPAVRFHDILRILPDIDHHAVPR